MDNPKNDAYFIGKILQDLHFITEHMMNKDIHDLDADDVLLDSMMFRLIQISENSKKLTDDYKELHANIPWHAVYGLRNRIVHDYGNVDLNIIFSTLKDDIPELLQIMETEPQNP